MKNALTPERPPRVGLISLGCAKNLVDAEIMLGSLLKQGVEITNDAASADALIVNTCSFIDAAQEESVDAILESAQLREARNRGRVEVTERGAVPRALAEDRAPAQPGLRALEREQLEQPCVLVLGRSPLDVVVLDHERQRPRK